MASAPQQPTGAPPDESLDPASQSLADALRKSFSVLKVLMLVLVVLYFLSGWFSVKQGESGIVYRLGRIVGVADGRPAAQAVLGSGWHWSWPFPIDRWQTIPTKERELPLEFMLALTARERATGVISQKFGALSPERDDYLVTGDVNILHASLKIKYRITNVIDYVTNVHPMPDPKATVTSKPYHHYNEYTILRNLARNSVIEAAATQAVLDIRGSKQDQFLFAVAKALRRRLKTLADRGAPLGIEIVNNGVIAPKGKSGKLESIMPPRQTQEVFDQVFTAQTNKSITIKKAQSQADALLLVTAGQTHEQIADAIEKEFTLLRKVSAAASGDSKSDAALQDLREQLDKQRKLTESLLSNAAGSVRSIIRGAEIRRDQIVKEARGDYQRFAAVLPEYLSNPRIFMTRLRDEAWARALSRDDVIKMYVPPSAKEYRLHIPQNNKPGEKKKDETDQSKNPFKIEEPLEIRKPF